MCVLFGEKFGQGPTLHGPLSLAVWTPLAAGVGQKNKQNIQKKQRGKNRVDNTLGNLM